MFSKRIVVGILILIILVCVFPYFGNTVTSEKISDTFHSSNIQYLYGYELNKCNYFDDCINNFNTHDNNFVYDDSSLYYNQVSAKKMVNQFDDGWNIETIDIQGNTGKYTSIAVDADNEPYICYYDVTNMDLKYAHKIGSNWTVQIVDSEYDCGWAGSSHSLALDSNGNAHIAYIEWITGTNIVNLKYAKWTGLEWNISLVEGGDGEEAPRCYPSIALDSNDNPLIIYIFDKTPFGQYNWGVKYCKWNNSAWEFETVAEPCIENGFTVTSLVLDSEGNPHITYDRIISFNPLIINLEYAYRTSRGWNIEVVDGGSECWFSCIAVDSNNNPHISYIKYTVFTDDAPYELKYAKRSDNLWINSTLEIGDCKHTSIVIDSNDHPHISYMGMLSYGSALKHAWWDGTKWIFSVVDTGGNKWTGLYTSTAIDSQGKCHISYYDGTDWEIEGNLKCAWGENTIPYNTEPNPPIISGPDRGKIGEGYDYNISSIDQDEDDLYYLIDWGDSTFEYSTRFPSAQELTKKHWWDKKGTYIIKAKAIDLHNAESEWGILEAKMPRTILFKSHLLNFLEGFPYAFSILKNLLKLQT